MYLLFTQYFHVLNLILIIFNNIRILWRHFLKILISLPQCLLFYQVEWFISLEMSERPFIVTFMIFGQPSGFNVILSILLLHPINEPFLDVQQLVFLMWPYFRVSLFNNCLRSLTCFYHRRIDTCSILSCLWACSPQYWNHSSFMLNIKLMRVNVHCSEYMNIIWIYHFVNLTMKCCFFTTQLSKETEWLCWSQYGISG